MLESAQITQEGHKEGLQWMPPAVALADGQRQSADMSTNMIFWITLALTCKCPLPWNLPKHSQANLNI